MAKVLRANELHLPSFLPSRSEIKFSENFDVRNDGIIADGKACIITADFVYVHGVE